MKFLITVLIYVACSESVKLPPNFRKCNRKDPEWRKCVFEAGVHGLTQLTKPYPELNIPNLDPLLVPEVTIESDPGSKTVTLTQYYRNVRVYGLQNVTADRFEFDFDKKEITIEGTFAEMRIEQEYKLEGKILLLPIQGEGNGVNRFQNLHVRVVMKFNEIKKKGKTYLKIVSSDMKIIPGRIIFKFDNLFNGDKVLGDNINKVLNENWKEVYMDLEESHTELVNKIFVNMVNNFFTKVSVEEAFD